MDKLFLKIELKYTRLDGIERTIIKLSFKGKNARKVPEKCRKKIWQQSDT